MVACGLYLRAVCLTALVGLGGPDGVCGELPIQMGAPGPVGDGGAIIVWWEREHSHCSCICQQYRLTTPPFVI